MMEIALSIGALVISVIAIIVSVVSYKRSRALAEAAAAKRGAWASEQIDRWRRGELDAKEEPCMFGDGSNVLVIEPEPGRKIVVGSVGYSKGVQRQH
jgi:hypothetical protein